MANSLSHELHALVHHVELSKAGWRDHALELMALRVIDSDGRTCSRAQVTERVNQMLAAPLGQAQVEKTLNRLIDQGKVVETNRGAIKLSEETMTALREQLCRQNEREQRIQTYFETTFADLSDRVEIRWADFRDHFVYPLVSELGAHAYELLSGEPIEVRHAESHLRFLTRVPAGMRGLVSDRIKGFLDARNHEVRGYMLRLLNAAFLVQATHLSDKTLEFVEARLGKTLRLHVFVDTNVLFSLIGIHANPADDVVKALHSLIDVLKGRLDVKLYVLPITLDEAKKTLSGYEKRLSGLALTQDMSRALKEGTPEISGITLRFVENGLQMGKRVSAEEYFSPYHSNLLQIARSKGVELYNAPTDPLRMDQDVIDDLLDQMSFEKERFPEDRRKSYQKILHDMVLWHFTRRKRPVRLESPIEAEFWAATIDFRLLRFDRYKRRQMAGEPPVCIHPTVLLQLLQLWVPRNELLEVALVTSLQPLIPHEFDRKAEEVTIRILRSLSRFEGSDAIGRDAVARILFDTAVRARIETAESAEEDIEVVRNALSNENQRLDLKVKELELERSGLKSEASEKEEEKRALQAQFENVESERDALLQALARQRRRSQEIEERLGKIETNRVVGRAEMWVGAAGLCGTAALAVLSWVALTTLVVPTPIVWTGSCFLGVGGGLAGASGMTFQKKAILAQRNWSRRLRQATAVYWSVVILGLAIELVGGWFSALLES